MIKHIIFDWGNVIEPDANLEAAKLLAKKFKLNMIDIYSDFEELEPYYATGEENQKKFFEHFKKKYNIEPKETQHALNAVEYRENIREILNQLKAKYSLHILSNQMSFRTTYIKEHEDIHYFDKLFFSSEMHFIKPRKEAYEYVLKELDAKPDECIFIDDREENVEGAKSLGMSAIQFIDINRLKEELHKREIDVN